MEKIVYLNINAKYVSRYWYNIMGLELIFGLMSNEVRKTEELKEASLLAECL